MVFDRLQALELRVTGSSCSASLGCSDQTTGVGDASPWARNEQMQALVDKVESLEQVAETLKDVQQGLFGFATAGQAKVEHLEKRITEITDLHTRHSKCPESEAGSRDSQLQSLPPVTAETGRWKARAHQDSLHA